MASEPGIHPTPGVDRPVTLVDSNVILDIITEDSAWAAAVAKLAVKGGARSVGQGLAVAFAASFEVFPHQWGATDDG